MGVLSIFSKIIQHVGLRGFYQNVFLEQEDFDTSFKPFLKSSKP